MNRQHLVMISGWAHSSSALSPLADILGKSFDIHATSPAELLSTASADKCLQEGLSPYASALRDLIQRINDPCIVLGWSMGAMITLEALAGRTMNVKKVIAVSPTARFCATDGYTCGFAEQNLRTLKKSIKRNPTKALEQFFHALSFPRTVSHHGVNESTKTALSTGADVLIHGLDYLLTMDLRTSLAGIAVPVLLIHGRQDRIIPWQAGEFIRQQMPDSRLVVYEDAGHGILHTHARKIASEIQP